MDEDELKQRMENNPDLAKANHRGNPAHALLQSPELTRKVARAVTGRKESEDDFLTWVIDLAHIRLWLVAHFRPAKTDKGWRTAVQADGKGFFDLVLVRDRRIILAELKSEKGNLSEDQDKWMRALGLVDSRYVEVHIWRPSDRAEIERTLR